MTDPRGTHEAVEAPIPRQRDAGVMGYVAELQQFDDSMTGAVPEAEPPVGRGAVPNRAPALGRTPPPGRASAADRVERADGATMSGHPAGAVAPGGAGDPTAPGYAGGAASASGTGAATTPSGTKGQAAAGGPAPAQGRVPAQGRAPAHGRAQAGGAAPDGRAGDAAEPPVPVSAGRNPAGHGSPRTGDATRVPGKEERPPWTRTEKGLAVAFVLVAAVAIVGGAYAVLVANRPPAGEVLPPLPSVEAADDREPVATGVPVPEGSGRPETEPSANAGPGGGAEPSPRGGPPPSGGTSATPEVSAPAADLVARYSREANTGLLGLTGYRGKVWITNRGQGAAAGWTVTLSLPAGQKVDSVEGAQARQEGDIVTFTPLADSGGVAAGVSVAFTFEVPGLLAGEPTGCAIDGRPCE